MASSQLIHSYIRIPVYKRLISYIAPVLLRKGKGDVNDILQVYLYRNQPQLATSDALYSDGRRYWPALAGINKIRAALPGIDDVLVLGCGLGSMVRVIRANGINPRFTLVEIDKVVLSWALEFLTDEDKALKISPVCTSAFSFMDKCTEKYGLIFTDIFNGMAVPAATTTPIFLMQCRNALAPGGRLIYNYILKDAGEWESLKNTFSIVFPNHQILSMGLNRLFVAVV